MKPKVPGRRYLDPLTSLAWMAGQTQSIMIGTSVLILPYRPKLPTAKAIATIQELSGERLLLGLELVGWTRSFGFGSRQAPSRSLSDEALAFLHDCFDNDIVTSKRPVLPV